MRAGLSDYIDRDILVSVPSLFGDVRCRIVVLIGVEVHGLWLQSDELTGRLLPGEMERFASMAPIIFVPFSQIGGVVIGTRPLALAQANGGAEKSG
jgi:hypothetical protein